jgi:WD40 repeat protein
MATLELEHCIGGNYTIPNSLIYHPNGKNTITFTGSAIIISDITDPHKQSFLHGHTGIISSLAMSANGFFLFYTLKSWIF